MESYNANLVQAVGDGTESNPFLISDKEAFLNIRTNLAAYYKLTTDLDFAGETIEPIGKSGTPLKGGIDGNGHMLKNFKINKEDYYTGLFSYAKDAKIKNLYIKNGEIKKSLTDSRIGILAGYLINCIVENICLEEITIVGGDFCGLLAGNVERGSIIGCSVKGNNLVSGKKQVGGLVGKAYLTTISANSVTGTGMVSGTEYVGGMIGESNCTIDFCYSTLEVKGNIYVGGLVGNGHGKINECFATGNITGSTYVGGLVGYGYITINKGYATGNVTGNSYVGGLIGYEKFDINDSFALGNVASTNNSKFTGGLAGYYESGSIKNCYAIGKVSQDGSGLAYFFNYVPVVDSYFDSVASGVKEVNNNNIGKLTTTLMRKSFFANWDFNSVWDISEGKTYPYLRNMQIPEFPTVKFDGFPSGKGTEEDPYLIGDAMEFDYLRYDLSGYYKLIADIDFEGKKIDPIGMSNSIFSGGLDGNGYTVRNFKISTNNSNNGLFRYARNSKIRNLRIENAQIKEEQNTGDSYTGALAGYLDNCTVENIALVNITIEGSRYVGALAGYVNRGSVTECSVREYILVTGGSTVGGLIGRGAETKIRKCIVVSNGLISGKGTTGGMIGNMFATTAECCYANIEVKGKDNVGGLVGSAVNMASKLSECCATGNVTGERHVGGLAGETDCGIKNSYARNNVISLTNDREVGGLLTMSSAGKDVSYCYAAGKISTNGNGLGYGSSHSCYFDSTLATRTLPTTQARMTEQMFNQETYVNWDWAKIWNIPNNSYPTLKNIPELIHQVPFELNANNLTYSSISISWPTIPEATGYDISYLDKIDTSANSTIEIQNLAPNTEYEFRVRAKIDTALGVWSKILKVKTKNLPQLDGLHSVDKGVDFITVMWNQVEDVQRYEVVCNNRMMETQTNTCTITGIETGVPFLICVTAVLSEGSRVVGNPIIEKIYTQNPQTDYASEFKDKCEGQTWFLDEMEKILNLKGKSLNTISSKKDFETIYALGLADRGISGKLPIAIGELSALEYLYLGNNNLSGELPAELTALEKLKEMDLTGNKFS